MSVFWAVTRRLRPHHSPSGSPSSSDLDTAPTPSASCPFFPLARQSAPILTYLAEGHERRRSPRQRGAARPAFNSATPAPAKVSPSNGYQEGLLKISAAKESFGKSGALSILLTARTPCLALRTARTATLNKQASSNAGEEEAAAAELLQYEDRRVLQKPGEKLRPFVRQAAFCARIKDLHPALFESYPQTARVLDNESDVAGAFLANIVNPILPIINAFLSKQFKDSYEVVPFTEVHIGKGGRSYLDIALMLVEKQHNADSLAHITVRHPLVIVELKRHHLVVEENWEHLQYILKGDGRKQQNACRLLPRLLVYADRWKCHRIYLSDYTHTIAFDIQPKEVAQRTKKVNLGIFQCLHKSKRGSSVYDYGPRLALAFDAVEGLCELGMVDAKLYPSAHPPFDSARLKKYKDK